MNDPAATAQRQQRHQQGVLVGLITLPLRFFGVLCGSLVLCIVIECIGLHLFWPDEGWHHARDMLAYELEQISGSFTHSMLIQEPGKTAHLLVTQAHRWLFVNSGLQDGMREMSHHARAGSHLQDNDFQYWTGKAWTYLESYAIATAYTVLVFLIRLLVLCMMLPLFLMAAFVGFVDGLVKRDIRRFGAGRESGFIYHRARATVMPLAVLPWVSYLALPVSVHPLVILLPGAILLGLAVNIAAGSFKKYL